MSKSLQKLLTIALIVAFGFGPSTIMLAHADEVEVVEEEVVVEEKVVEVEVEEVIDVVEEPVEPPAEESVVEEAAEEVTEDVIEPVVEELEIVEELVEELEEVEVTEPAEETEIEAVEEPEVVTQEETIAEESVVEEVIAVTSIARVEEVEEESAVVTYEGIEVDVPYTYKDSGLGLVFTSLPDGETDHFLKMEEIVLTDEQIKEYGALSPIAYDVTSSLTNGTFTYNLKLPVVVEASEDVVVAYAQDEDSLADAVEIEEEKTNVETSYIELEGLDHFTIFFVATGQNTTSTDSGSSTYSVSQETALSTSDDSRVSKAWGVTTLGEPWYQEFQFSSSYPDGATITDVDLTVELYREGNVDQIEVWSYDTADAQFEYLGDAYPASNGAGSEETFTFDVTSDHVDTAAELNAYKFRIYAKSSTTASATDTFTDYVALSVTVSDSVTDLAPTTNSYVSATSSAVTHSWSALAHAEFYEFERCTTDPGVGTCSSVIESATTTSTSYDIPMSTNSAYYWRVRAEHNDSTNSPWSDVKQITVDSTLPTDPSSVSSSSHTANATSSNNVIVVNFSGASDALAGVDGFAYLFDNAPDTVPDNTNKDAEETATTTTSSALADGTWYFHLSTRDNAGNWTSTVHAGPFGIDTVPPAIPTPTAPTDGTFMQSNAFTQKWTSISDAASYGYESCNTDPGDAGAACGSIKATSTYSTNSRSVSAGEAEGNWWWRVNAKDAAGNESDYSVSYEITIDDTAPTTTISSPTTSSNWNSAITIKGNTIDKNNVDKVKVQYSTDGSSWTDLTEIDNVTNSDDFDWSYTWTPGAEAEYYIRAFGTDLAGNTNNYESVSDIDYDLTSPALNIIAPGDDSFVSGAIGFTANGTASDTLSGVDKVEIDWYTEAASTTLVSNWSTTYSASGGTWERSFTSSDIADDLYLMRVTAYDEAGNVIAEDSRRVRIDSVSPEIVLDAPNPFTFEVHSAYVEPGYTATDDIDGDITSSVVASSTVNTSVLGTYAVDYNVKDNAGNSAKTVTRVVNIVDTTPPVLTLNGDNPMNLDVGGSYVDPGATAIDNYDGDISSSIVVTGTVDDKTAGTYSVTYTVTDSSKNTSTATRIIVVPVSSGGPVSYGVGPSILAPSSGGGGGGGGGQVLGASTGPGNGSVAPNVDIVPVDVNHDFDYPLWSKQSGFINDEILAQLIADAAGAGQVLGDSAANDALIAMLKVELEALKAELMLRLQEQLAELTLQLEEASATVQ